MASSKLPSTLRVALFCFAPDQNHRLEQEPVLLVVPESLKHELQEADAKGIPTLTLYASDGWQRALEHSRPDTVITIAAPPELTAELRLQGYLVQQEEPEAPRKAPE